MNKNLIRLTIAAWVLVLVLSTLAFGTFVFGRLWGGGLPWSVMGMPFHIAGQIGRNIHIDGVGNELFGTARSNRNFAGYTEQQDISISEEVSTIDLEWVSGKVQILRSENSEIRAVHTGNRSNNKKMMVKVESGNLSIADQYTTWMGNMPASNVELYLPDKIYRKIDLETVSANVESVYLQCDELDIESVSGNISLSCRADQAFLESVSGTIRLNDSEVMDLDISTVSGNMEVTGAVSVLSAESVSGTAKAMLKNAPKAIDIESISGDVYLSLPDNTGFDLSASGVKDLTSEFSLIGQGQGRHRYKEGGPQHEVSTLSGKLVLKKVG